jgi:hypothetical protein
MAEAFFTSLAVIEVFANRALVTDTLDRVHTTTIAFNIQVDNIVLRIIVEVCIWVFWDGSAKVLVLQQLREDFSGLLLEFIVDHVLKSLAWNGLLLAGLFLLLDAFGWQVFFVDHFKVFNWVDRSGLLLLFEVRVSRLLE